MNDKELRESVYYLVKKYLSDRQDLIDLIDEDIDATKFILSEISKKKEKEYDEKDKEIVKDISFYFI